MTVAIANGYLTFEEVAMLMKVSTHTVKYRSKNGSLPRPIKIGRRYLFRERDVIEAIDPKAVRQQEP